MLSKLIDFIKTDIWRIRLTNYSRTKSFLIKQLRIIALAVRFFTENKCTFRASALTFFTLLSIVPVIAMMFGIAKGFGLEKKVETQILQRMQGQEEVATKIIDFANSLLENTSGGFIAGIGVVLLFWTIISLLSNIESSFNDIWGVKKPRSFARKFSDYLSMVLICPVLLALSGSITVVISTQVQLLLDKIPFFRSTIGPLVLALLSILPYCTIWFMFTFVFVFMPNTKVRFSSALLAGIVAGTVCQIVQWGYIKFQIGAAKYGAIYGSFAALPLFLIWLQLSWYIVLFGAELSFAHQNVDTYEFEQDCLSISHAYKRLLSLLIAQLLVKNFHHHEKPLDASKISHMLEIPIRLVRQILFELTEAGVISEVKYKQQEKELAYQPALDLDTLTLKYVIDALESRGNTSVPVIQSVELNKLSDSLKAFAEVVEKSPQNIPLKNM